MKKSINFSTVNSTHFLLDTHVFIWSMSLGKRLGKEVKSIIQNPQNRVFVSVATVWEIMIKKKLKQIRAPLDLEGEIKKAGFEVLSMDISHVLPIEKLPLYHKDPFDRILVCQAQVENFTLITHDKQIWQYDVDVLRT